MSTTKTLFATLAILLASGYASLNTSWAGGVPRDEAPAAGSSRLTEETDFWQQVRAGLRLPAGHHRAITRNINTYRHNTRQLERLLNQGEPWLAYINNEVKRRNFPTEITLLPFVESGYDPMAYSHGSAAGLWQFIPGTGKHYGLKQDWWVDGRRDVIAATEAALNYLDRLQKEFDGDWLLALAAYNAGEGTVRKAIKRNRRAGKPVDFWHLKLPRETSSYVPKLLAISTIIKRPEKYGINLTPVDSVPPFTIVDTHHQLDLGIAAELANIGTEELYQLNPGFNRWATHPDGPHRLLIPAEKAAAFEQNLASLPASQRVKWVRHKIRPGDTLSQIARHHDTTVAVIRSTNELQGSHIRAGKHLLVPVAAKDPSRYAALDRLRRSPRTAGSKLTYHVKSGESLWNIARRNQVSVGQLTTWNRLDNKAVIKPGQKLVIWKKGSTPHSGNTTRPVSYTVRNGDSLYLISRKFKVSINDLRQWNKLPKGKYLQPGQRLKLYVDVTRQS